VTVDAQGAAFRDLLSLDKKEVYEDRDGHGSGTLTVTAAAAFGRARGWLVTSRSRSTRLTSIA
jgi:hypothetical protein